MPRSFTVALSICLECQHAFGVNLWPWSGERLKQTHGLCRGCQQRLSAAFVDEPDRAPPPSALPDAAASRLPEAGVFPPGV